MARARNMLAIGILLTMAMSRRVDAVEGEYTTTSSTSPRSIHIMGTAPRSNDPCIQDNCITTLYNITTTIPAIATEQNTSFSVPHKTDAIEDQLRSDSEENVASSTSDKGFIQSYSDANFTENDGSLHLTTGESVLMTSAEDLTEKEVSQSKVMEERFSTTFSKGLTDESVTETKSDDQGSLTTSAAGLSKSHSPAEDRHLTTYSVGFTQSDVSPTEVEDEGYATSTVGLKHSKTPESFSSTSDKDLFQIDPTSTSRPHRTTSLSQRRPQIDMGLISRSQYQKVKFITGCIMLVLPLIGMVLNSVNIAIFSSPQLKCPSSTILVCLSVAELFVIAIQMIARTVDFVLGIESVYSLIYLNVTKYLAIYASAVFGRTTYYLVLLVAAERLLAVAFPLRAMYFRLIHKPLIACALILLTCASYHVYVIFKNDVVKFSPAVNDTRYRLGSSSFYTNHRDAFMGLHVSGEIMFVYIPLLSCLILNVILIMIMHRNSRKKVLLNSTQNFMKIYQAERQTTITIMVSTFIFIFLVLPKPLGGLLASIKHDYGIYTKEHYLFLTVSKFAAVSNLLANCTNFIVYYTLGGVFRKTLHSKLCKLLQEEMKEADLFV